MYFIHRLANLHSAMRDDYLEQYGFIEKFRDKYDKVEIGIIKEILNEGCINGIFEITDLEVTAVALITALKGFEYSWIEENNVAKAEKSIDNLMGILFNGIVKR